MGRDKKNIGAAGEDLAAAYLRKIGYKILESNFRTPFGESFARARAMRPQRSVRFKRNTEKMRRKPRLS